MWARGPMAATCQDANAPTGADATVHPIVQSPAHIVLLCLLTMANNRSVMQVPGSARAHCKNSKMARVAIVGLRTPSMHQDSMPKLSTPCVVKTDLPRAMTLFSATSAVVELSRESTGGTGGNGCISLAGGGPTSASILDELDTDTAVGEGGAGAGAIGGDGNGNASREVVPHAFCQTVYVKRSYTLSKTLRHSGKCPHKL